MQEQPLVPLERLASAKKVLFIAHLAIGDYQYLQTFFHAFAQRWPHIEIHLWADELRRTRLFWRWKKLKQYSLYDWLVTSPLFSYVYTKTYSPKALRASKAFARKQHYDVVISLAWLHAGRYASLARSVAGKNAFVVGIERSTRWWQIVQQLQCKQLDARLMFDSFHSDQKKHITDFYAQWFRALFGITVEPAQRKPYITIPREWLVATSLLLLKWGINRKQPRPDRLFFVNAFAKDKKRCWPLPRVFDYIRQLQRDERYEHVHFIINTPPESYQESVRIYREYGVKQSHLFSARDNFFQLPAMISLCDLVISVETAVMHIAAALDKPVIALMRTKNPEWAPWDTGKNSIVHTAQRIEWVKDIPMHEVLAATNARTIER